MDPALILGPYGVVVVLMVGVVHLYRENQELRKGSMDLLKQYQERDAEERKARIDEEQRRDEEQRKREETQWLAQSESLQSGDRRRGETRS